KRIYFKQHFCYTLKLQPWTRDIVALRSKEFLLQIQVFNKRSELLSVGIFLNGKLKSESMLALEGIYDDIFTIEQHYFISSILKLDSECQAADSIIMHASEHHLHKWMMQEAGKAYAFYAAQQFPISNFSLQLTIDKQAADTDDNLTQLIHQAWQSMSHAQQAQLQQQQTACRKRFSVSRTYHAYKSAPYEQLTFNSHSFA